MKGKKVDPEFVSEFISTAIQSGYQTTDDIVAFAQAEIQEIDEEIKRIETRKIRRGKLVDVVNSFSKPTKPNKQDEIRILSFFKIQNINICKFICKQIKDEVTTIDELSKMNYPISDVLFCIKQLLEHRILSKSGTHLLRGELFDEYLKFVLKEV
jgi:hypothetical protein